MARPVCRKKDRQRNNNIGCSHAPVARLKLDVAQRRGFNITRAELYLALLVLLAVAIGGWNDPRIR